MDWWFWTGLGLGALIGLPVSIVANLWTDRVRDYLGKRRTIRLSKKKSKEVSTYLYVRALVEGRPGAKILLDLDASLTNRLTTASAIYLMLSVFAFVMIPYPNLQPYRGVIGAFGAFFATLGFVATLFVMPLHLYLTDIRRKVSRFHDYENSIREKWGDDAIEEFLQSETRTEPTKAARELLTGSRPYFGNLASTCRAIASRSISVTLTMPPGC